MQLSDCYIRGRMRVVWAYQLRAFNESEHADHAEDTIVAYQMMQGLVDLARTFASNRRCSNPLLEHLPYDHESYKLLREFVAAIKDTDMQAWLDTLARRYA